MSWMRTPRRKLKKGISTPSSQKVVIRLDGTASAEIETNPAWVYIENPSDKLVIQYGSDSHGDPVQTSLRTLPGADKDAFAYKQHRLTDEMYTIPRDVTREPQHWTTTPGPSRAGKDEATVSPLKTQRYKHSPKRQLYETTRSDKQPLRDGLETLQADLEDRAAAISKAAATIATLCDDNAKLRSQLERQVTKHRQQLMDSCAIAKRAVEARHQLWSQLHEKANEVRQVKDEAEELRQRSADLKSQLLQLANVADRVKSDNKALKQQVKELREQLGSRQDQSSYLTAMEAELQKLKAQLYDTQKRLHSEKLLTEEALLEKESAQLQKTEAVAEVHRLRFQLEERAGAASAARAEAEGLRRQVAELEEQLRSQRQRLAEALELARQEGSYSRELEGEVAQLKEQLQDKVLAAGRAREEAEGLRRQVADVQAQLDARQRDAAGRLEVEGLRRAAVELRNQLEQQRRQLGAALKDRLQVEVGLDVAPPALPREIPVYCTGGDDTRMNSVLRLGDGGGPLRPPLEVAVLCRCRAECGPGGVWVSPAEWAIHQGLRGRSWSEDIRVDLRQFPELRLGHGKNACGIGKFLNLHGYDWSRASNDSGGCPTLTPAFQHIAA